MIALGLVKALGLRGTVVLACLLVLSVTGYGVAQDLGLLETPAKAAPAQLLPERTPGRRTRPWSDSTLPIAASTDHEMR